MLYADNMIWLLHILYTKKAKAYGGILRKTSTCLEETNTQPHACECSFIQHCTQRTEIINPPKIPFLAYQMVSCKHPSVLDISYINYFIVRGFSYNYLEGIYGWLILIKII